MTHAGKKSTERMSDDDYYRHPLVMSPSHCRKCKYQGTTRYGDLTIGDCWGVQHYDRNINASHGVSVILVNNEKGREFLNSIPKDEIGIMRREPLAQIKKYNVCAFQENRNWPATEPRTRFYNAIRGSSFKDSVRRALE